jgi:phage terminase large subunit-like protein
MLDFTSRDRPTQQTAPKSRVTGAGRSHSPDRVDALVWAVHDRLRDGDADRAQQV